MTFAFGFRRILGLGLGLLISCGTLQAKKHTSMTTNYKNETWIALGDSITEGATYDLWTSQSIKAAGRTAPHWFNAGVGGNTAAQMLARLERDVIEHHPDRVFFNAGINDVLSGRSAEWLASVPQILDRLKAAGIPTYVLTTTALTGKHAELNASLITMNEQLRKMAQERGFTIVEVFTPFLAAVEKGEPVIGPDGVHLTLEGYRVMTTAILQALDPAIPVAQNFDPKLEAGVPLDWEIRNADTDAPVWKVHLPETGQPTTGNWWQDFERVRGYVLNLHRFDANAKKFAATATFDLAEPGPVFVRLGGGVQSITIDGVPVAIPPTNTLWGIRDTGWSQPLEAGKHKIDIIAVNVFLVSCLPKSEWPSR